eukprot:scaffold74372_cov57-Attheya_sp.AAC.4
MTNLSTPSHWGHEVEEDKPTFEKTDEEEIGNQGETSSESSTSSSPPPPIMGSSPPSIISENIPSQKARTGASAPPSVEGSPPIKDIDDSSQVRESTADRIENESRAYDKLSSENKKKSSRKHRRKSRSSSASSSQYPPMPMPRRPRSYEAASYQVSDSQHLSSPDRELIPFLSEESSQPELLWDDGSQLEPRVRCTSVPDVHMHIRNSNGRVPDQRIYNEPPASVKPGAVPPKQFSPLKELLSLKKGFTESPRDELERAPMRSGAYNRPYASFPDQYDSSPKKHSSSPPAFLGGQPMTPTRSSALRSVSRRLSTDGVSPVNQDLERSYGKSANVSFSPSTPLFTAEARAGMDYNAIPSMAPMTPPVPELHSGRSRKSVSIGSRGRSSSNVRKMHMRQQSVQLFMSNSLGTEQPKQCRDLFFALLFLVQLVVLVFVGSIFEPVGLREAAMGEPFVEELIVLSPTTEAKWTVYYLNVIRVALMCGALSMGLSVIALGIMTMIARRLVQVALIFSILLSFAWGTIGIGLSPKSVVPVTVWDRIPFASANLMTGMSSIRANWGTLIVAFICQCLMLVWTLFFSYVTIGVYDATKQGRMIGGHRMHAFFFALLALSYYWTFRVIAQAQQVLGGLRPSRQIPADMDKSAKAVEATNFANPSRGQPFCPLVQSALEASLLAQPSYSTRQLNIFAHIGRAPPHTPAFECIISCVDGLAYTCNAWSFTFIGLYGYGFVDAGHNAIDLFRKRGWTSIVTDDLIPTVLLMVSLVIGGVTGGFAMLIENIQGFGLFPSFGQPQLSAFLIGFGVGTVLSSVLFGLINSSVNASIVCFAGSPVEFESNHPELSNEMRTAWREVWPGCIDALDLSDALKMEAGGTPQRMLIV